jgi:hypothetical protein
VGVSWRRFFCCPSSLSSPLLWTCCAAGSQCFDCVPPFIISVLAGICSQPRGVIWEGQWSFAFVWLLGWRAMIADVLCSPFVTSFFAFTIIWPCGGRTFSAFTSSSFRLFSPVFSAINFPQEGSLLPLGKMKVLVSLNSPPMLHKSMRLWLE